MILRKKMKVAVALALVGGLVFCGAVSNAQDAAGPDNPPVAGALLAARSGALPAGIILKAGVRQQAGNQWSGNTAFCDGSLGTRVQAPPGSWYEMEFRQDARVGWLDLWLSALPGGSKPAVEALAGAEWKEVPIRTAYAFQGAKVLRLELEPVVSRGLRFRFPADVAVLEAAPASGRPYETAGRIMLECAPVSQLLEGEARNCLCVGDMPQAGKPAATLAKGTGISNGFLQVAAEREGERDDLMFMSFLPTGNGESQSVRVAATDLLRVELTRSGGAAKPTAEAWTRVEIEPAVTDMDAAAFSIRLSGKRVVATLRVSVRRGEHFVRIEPALGATDDGAGLLVHSVTMPNLERMAPATTFFGLEFPQLPQPQDADKPPALTYFPGVTLQAGVPWDAVAAVWGLCAPGEDRILWLREYYRLVSPAFRKPATFVEYSLWAAQEGGRLTQQKMRQIRMLGGNCINLCFSDVANGWAKPFADVEGKPAFENALKELRENGLQAGFYCGLSFLAPCYLVPERPAVMERLKRILKRYDMDEIVFDFYGGGQPCKEQGHLHPYHPEGLYSAYWNNRALMEMRAELRRLRPGIVIGGQVGEGQDPQFGRPLDYVHSGNDWMEHLQGGAIPEPDPVRRQNIWSYVYAVRSIFCPRPSYRMLSTFGRYDADSPKLRTYRYDPATWEQSVAMSFTCASNVWAYGPPLSAAEEDLAQIRRWVEWNKANQDLLMRLECLFPEKHSPAGDLRDEDVLGGLRQVRGGRGFLLLYNPTFRAWEGSVRFSLPRAAHLRERFPVDRELEPVAPGDRRSFRVEPKTLRLIELAEQPLDAGSLALRATAFQPRTIHQWNVVHTEGDTVTLQGEFTLTAEELANSGPIMAQVLLTNLEDKTAREWSDVAVEVNSQRVLLLSTADFRDPTFGRGLWGGTFGEAYDKKEWYLPARPCATVVPQATLVAGKNTVTITIPNRAGTVFHGCHLRMCWWKK